MAGKARRGEARRGETVNGETERQGETGRGAGERQDGQEGRSAGGWGMDGFLRLPAGGGDCG